MTISQEQLLTIIGSKEVIIAQLNGQIIDLKTELAKVRDLLHDSEQEFDDLTRLVAGMDTRQNAERANAEPDDGGSLYRRLS
jgi:hypothetical protein